MLEIREDWGDMVIGVIMEEKKSLGVAGLKWLGGASLLRLIVF